MWIDITIGVLFALFLISGSVRGFAVTLTRTVGWPAALVAGYLFCRKLSLWLQSTTAVYDKIFAVVEPKVKGLTDSALQSFLDELPKALADLLRKNSDGTQKTLAENLTNVLLTVACFLAIVLVLRLILFLFTLLFSKRYHKKGLVGGTDRLLGIVFGAVSGAFAVFAFLALLLPVAEFFNIEGIPEALAASRVARPLYEHNMLFWLAERFLIKG